MSRSNNFSTTPRPLLVAAIALDRAERVIFGQGDLMDVPISQAIAASSAIPGFFEPYRIGGRDYVDSDVGYTGHLFNVGLREIKLLRPDVDILVVQPEPKPSPLVGPSMGFEASRAAFRHGSAP